MLMPKNQGVVQQCNQSIQIFKISLLMQRCHKISNSFDTSNHNQTERYERQKLECECHLLDFLLIPKSNMSLGLGENGTNLKQIDGLTLFKTRPEVSLHKKYKGEQTRVSYNTKYDVRLEVSYNTKYVDHKNNNTAVTPSSPYQIFV